MTSIPTPCISEIENSDDSLRAPCDFDIHKVTDGLEGIGNGDCKILLRILVFCFIGSRFKSSTILRETGRVESSPTVARIKVVGVAE